jgi:uncharacterized phage protein (TIGR01671 family)
MREIKFRGKGLENGVWVYGSLILSKLYADGKRNAWIREESYLPLGGINTPTVNFIQVDPKTIGQFTERWDKNKQEMYEGDIVKILTNRVPKYNQENKRGSKFDTFKTESRSIIVFDNCEWRLFTDTDFNKKILALKGDETEERKLTLREHLKDYDFFQESNPYWKWNRKENSHAYWFDIEVIGNIHENPELLKPKEASE